MKAKITALTIALMAGPAYAQSGVTLYGIVDTGISYYNNAAGGGKSIGMPAQTGELPSRWGLKGREDLGSGYSAFFSLENGFQPGTGALNYGGRLFGRLANVGVSSTFGSLTLGRQLNMTIYVLANADVIGPSIHSMADFDSYIPNARSDNAVGYMGTFRGVMIGGTYSLGRDAAGPSGPSATNCPGQVPGNFVACRQYTALLSYDANNFGVAGSADVMRGGAGALAPLNNASYTDTRTVIDGYVKFGWGKLGAGWIRRNLAAASHIQSDIVFLGGTYYINPAFAIDVQGVRYQQRGETGKDGKNSTLLIGRANYLLSKKTTLYTSVGYMFNSAQAANAVASAGSVATGLNQLGVMIGMQNRF